MMPAKSRRRGRADRHMPKCARCLVKWAQRAGLCRRCGQEEGIYAPNTPEARREAEAMQAMDLAALAGELEPSIPLPPRRVIQVNGVEYEVVFP